MRVLIGAAMATVMFWLAVVAAAVAYVIEHAFAVAFGAAIVLAAMVVARLLPRRRRPAVRSHQSQPAELPPAYPVPDHPAVPYRFQEMPR